MLKVTQVLKDLQVCKVHKVHKVLRVMLDHRVQLVKLVLKGTLEHKEI